MRQDDTTAHDLGFLIQTSFGRGATLVGAASDARVDPARGGGPGQPLRPGGRGDPLR